MKLYNSFGMNPRSVRMFLLEKGIDIERVEIDLLAGDNRKEPYLSKCPTGQTPALELEDGTVLSESVVICEFLEEMHPEKPLIGVTAEDRAVARMWWRRTELGICRPAVFAFYYGAGYDLFKERVHCIPQAADDLKEIARKGMIWLDGLLKPGCFIAGDRFTVGDITLFCYLDQLSVAGQPIPEECKKLTAWYERVASRPSASASIFPVQPMGMRG